MSAVATKTGTARRYPDEEKAIPGFNTGIEP
jgi:hypothetical protein